MMITNLCLAMSRHPILEIFARHLAIARWRGLVWRGGEVGPTTLSVLLCQAPCQLEMIQ